MLHWIKILIVQTVVSQKHSYVRTQVKLWHSLQLPRTHETGGDRTHSPFSNPRTWPIMVCFSMTLSSSIKSSLSVCVCLYLCVCVYQRCIVQVPESRNPVQQLFQPSLNQLLYQVDELISENTCSRCRGGSKNMAGFLLSGTWTIHVWCLYVCA